MSVLSVHRKHIGGLTQNENGIQQTYVYQVVCSTHTDDEVVALSAVDPMGSNPMNGTRNVPAYFSVHPSLTAISVINKRVEREGKNASFLVYVDYGVPPLYAFEASHSGRWNQRLRCQGSQHTEGVNQDSFGVGMRNSYGDVYPADIPQELYDTVYCWTFNIDSIGAIAQAMEICRGKMNDASVTLNVDGYTRTFPPLTLKMIDGSWEWQKMPDGTYERSVEINLAYRHQLDATEEDTNGDEIGWDLQIVDRGYTYFDNNDKPFTSKTIVNLDGFARKLPDGDPEILIRPIVNPDTADFDSLF